MSANPIPTILHVDDDPNDTLLLKHACQAANVSFSLQAVSDGEVAMTYLSGAGEYADRQRHPLPDLMLLDLKMPRKTGFEVLEWLRARPELKRLPVCVFTSSKQQEDIDRAYQLGANAYVVKPVGFNSLVEAVKQIHAWLTLNEKPSPPR